MGYALGNALMLLYDVRDTNTCNGCGYIEKANADKEHGLDVLVWHPSSKIAGIAQFRPWHQSFSQHKRSLQQVDVFPSTG